MSNVNPREGCYSMGNFMKSVRVVFKSRKWVFYLGPPTHLLACFLHKTWYKVRAEGANRFAILGKDS